MGERTPLQIAYARVREAEALVAMQRAMMVKAIREKRGMAEAEALLCVLKDSLAGYRRELLALK